MLSLGASRLAQSVFWLSVLLLCTLGFTVHSVYRMCAGEPSRHASWSVPAPLASCYTCLSVVNPNATLTRATRRTDEARVSRDLPRRATTPTEPQASSQAPLPTAEERAVAWHVKAHGAAALQSDLLSLRTPVWAGRLERREPTSRPDACAPLRFTRHQPRGFGADGGCR